MLSMCNSGPPASRPPRGAAGARACRRVARLLLPLLPALLDAAPAWTADRAIATALRQSPDAALAQLREEAAAALVAETRAAWRPRLDLAGRYTQTNSPVLAFSSVLNQRALAFDQDFNHPARTDNLGLTGTVSYALYHGGRAAAGRAAAAGTRAAGQDARATRHQLAVATLSALLQLRQARAAVTALDAGTAALAAAVANARLHHAAGQLLRADLLSLEVQLAQSRERLIRARQGASLAERAFWVILGLEGRPDGPVELAPADPVLAALTAPVGDDPAARPELAALQARLAAAEAGLAAARGQRRPTVNAFAAYDYNQGWTLDRRAGNWLAGVSFDVNLFDGGRTAARVRLAAAELAQAQARLRQARLGLTLEIERARLAHAAARERLAVTAEAVAQAEESAALSRARFEAGVLLAADLIGVEARLLETRLHRIEAEADERLAVAHLRVALGLAPLPEPTATADPS